MKLLVIGLGQCGCRIADEFAALNERARAHREHRETRVREDITEPHVLSNIHLSKLHPAIAGLLQELPAPSSSWNKRSKEQFKSAFEAILDLIYPAEE